MNIRKRFLAMPFLTFIILTIFSTNASASELTPEEIEHLTTLGFSEDIASSVTKEEYVEYYQDLTAADESQSVTNYYNFVSNKYLPEGTLEVTKYSEAEAFREMNKLEQFAVGINNSTWLAMTLSSTKLTNGRVLLKNEFMWKKGPQVFFKDAFAITHSANVVRYDNTINFRYIFRDIHGSDRYYTGSNEKNNNGVATLFDIKGEPGYSHTGYLSVEANRSSSSDIRSNIFGHYTHMTIGFTGSVTITTGDISLGLAAKESKADDASITHEW
ncbi:MULTISPECIES: hypothetical protein [Lysinibacillus]|uniref:hypothetical protein n=1 Tax=Lysinibacillus TaxID=400634 RepID=UPI000A843050|nr:MULTISPECIES: hypothetical protein [Lysinibacillus]